jgi:carbonic anhydrase/acetyltransferase-like protein (isoleucine patch superfamily)
MDDDGRRTRLEPGWTRIDADAFVAAGAVVLGDVHVGPGASLWFGAVLRGDVERIRIGARTNIQDGSIVHADPGFPCLLGEGVTVGHRCVVHGAIVGAGSLVGMGAILMNGVDLGEECLIGASALVTEGKHIPPRSLVLGSPGKVVRALTAAELENLRRSAEHYVAAGRAYKAAGYQLAATLGW